MKTYNHSIQHAVGILLITLLNLLLGGVALAADSGASNSIASPALSGDQIVPSQNTRQKMPHADRKLAAERLKAHYQAAVTQKIQEHVKKSHGYSGEGVHGDHGYQGGQDHLGDQPKSTSVSRTNVGESDSKKRGEK